MPRSPPSLLLLLRLLLPCRGSSAADVSVCVGGRMTGDGVVVGVLVVMRPRRRAAVGIGVGAGVGGRQATVDA
jgi:hypothetical protein